MDAPQVALLPDGRRLHLQHGPIDLVIEAFGSRGVPCGPINTIPRVLDDPQVKHREMVRMLPHPLAGEVPQIVSPMKFSNAALAFDRPPPLLGEHTKAILAELYGTFEAGPSDADERSGAQDDERMES